MWIDWGEEREEDEMDDRCGACDRDGHDTAITEVGNGDRDRDRDSRDETFPFTFT